MRIPQFPLLIFQTLITEKHIQKLVSTILRMKISPNSDIVLKLFKAPFKPIGSSEITPDFRIKLQKISVTV
ncbi:MAG: hypothetical protein PWQ25_1237, partial [Deferribacteres bacterium]|nr:hypothetical protein [Deferribacteres bacterium]